MSITSLELIKKIAKKYPYVEIRDRELSAGNPNIPDKRIDTEVRFFVRFRDEGEFTLVPAVRFGFRHEEGVIVGGGEKGKLSNIYMNVEALLLTGEHVSGHVEIYKVIEQIKGQIDWWVKNPDKGSPVLLPYWSNVGQGALL